MSDAENIENDNTAHHVTNERPLEITLDAESEHLRDSSEITLAQAFSADPSGTWNENVTSIFMNIRRHLQNKP